MKPIFSVRNQSFIIVEDAQLPAQRGWDGICGLGWKGIAQLEGPIYQHLQQMGQKALGGISVIFFIDFMLKKWDLGWEFINNFDKNFGGI